MAQRARSEAASNRRSPIPTVGWITLTAIAPVTWGTTYLATTELLPEGHPVFAAFMRTLPPGLLGLLIARRLPRGDWWWKSFVLGGLNMAAFFPLLFIAAQRLPGGVAATLGAIQPLVVALLAWLILREHLTVLRVFWSVLGACGVSMVVLGPEAAMDPLGVLAGLGGAVSMGAGVVLTKRWGRPEGAGSMTIASWQLSAAGVLLVVPALAIDGVPPDIDARAIAGYTWLGLVGALIAYSLFFAGIARLPVTSTALLGLLSQLTAAALGVVVAGESLNAVQLLGFAIALTAMVAAQIAAARTPQQSEGADQSTTNPNASQSEAHRSKENA